MSAKNNTARDVSAAAFRRRQDFCESPAPAPSPAAPTKHLLVPTQTIVPRTIRGDEGIKRAMAAAAATAVSVASATKTTTAPPVFLTTEISLTQNFISGGKVSAADTPASATAAVPSATPAPAPTAVQDRRRSQKTASVHSDSSKPHKPMVDTDPSGVVPDFFRTITQCNIKPTDTCVCKWTNRIRIICGNCCVSASQADYDESSDESKTHDYVVIRDDEKSMTQIVDSLSFKDWKNGQNGKLYCKLCFINGCPHSKTTKHCIHNCAHQNEKQQMIKCLLCETFDESRLIALHEGIHAPPVDTENTLRESHTCMMGNVIKCLDTRKIVQRMLFSYAHAQNETNMIVTDSGVPFSLTRKRDVSDDERVRTPDAIFSHILGSQIVEQPIVRGEFCKKCYAHGSPSNHCESVCANELPCTICKMFGIHHAINASCPVLNQIFDDSNVSMRQQLQLMLITETLPDCYIPFNIQKVFERKSVSRSGSRTVTPCDQSRQQRRTPTSPGSKPVQRWLKQDTRSAVQAIVNRLVPTNINSCAAKMATLYTTLNSTAVTMTPRAFFDMFMSGAITQTSIKFSYVHAAFLQNLIGSARFSTFAPVYRYIDHMTSTVATVRSGFIPDTTVTKVDSTTETGQATEGILDVTDLTDFFQSLIDSVNIEDMDLLFQSSDAISQAQLDAFFADNQSATEAEIETFLRTTTAPNYHNHLVKCAMINSFVSFDSEIRRNSNNTVQFLSDDLRAQYTALVERTFTRISEILRRGDYAFPRNMRLTTSMRMFYVLIADNSVSDFVSFQKSSTISISEPPKLQYTFVVDFPALQQQLRDIATTLLRTDVHFPSTDFRFPILNLCEALLTQNLSRSSPQPPLSGAGGRRSAAPSPSQHTFSGAGGDDWESPVTRKGNQSRRQQTFSPQNEMIDPRSRDSSRSSPFGFRPTTPASRPSSRQMKDSRPATPHDQSPSLHDDPRRRRK